MDNQIQRGQTSLFLLDALSNGGDKYGAEFLSYINSKYPNFDIKQPTLYSTLSRMEKQGLISSYWRDSDIGGKRHYYSLTDFGKKTFEDQKNELNAINEEKKYDEIGGFQKKDEQVITNQTSSQILSTQNVAVQTKDDGRFLDANETYYIPEEKYDEIGDFEKNCDELYDDKKDDGIFITDTMTENQIPKVKKITSDLNFEINNSENSFEDKIVKPIQNETPAEKIENLYNKQKNTNFEDQKISSQSIASLSQRYKNMNINFYSGNNESEKVFENFGQIPKTKLFAKYFTIFMLILIETIGVWCCFYFTKGAVQYQFAYIILPIIFAIIAFSILFSKKKFYKFERQSGKHFWIYALIFIVGLGLLYSLNLLLGITISKILEYETTFIYPAIMFTNVLVSGIFDKCFSKKYS